MIVKNDIFVYIYRLLNRGYELYFKSTTNFFDRV